MDERRLLLERVYSRAGASEKPEPRLDPVTGETVRMTSSEWALTEYDRAHADDTGDPAEVARRNDNAVQRSDRRADAIGDVLPPAALTSRRGSGESTSRPLRAVPVLAAVGGLVLGSLLTLGVEDTATSDPPQDAAGGMSRASLAPPGIAAVGTGDGDEADTLSAVARYFADTPTALPLSLDTTRGFDATSFRLVAGDVSTRESSAIYAARRLDGAYCLVAVTGAGRAADVCATLDDITRKGLWLAKDAVQANNGRHVTVTVTWATDGTITWVAVPAAG
ncbi:hypothetical protein ACX9R5_12725 [Rathayibacter sp. CAU 1779]